jgi:hypothetical protein
MIGTQEEADVIANWDVGKVHAPAFWEYIAEGTYRKAYLSPSGIVYKKEKTSRGDRPAGNIAEFHNMSMAVEIPVPGWRIPQFGIFFCNGEPIISMEYVIGHFVEWKPCDPYGDGYCECDEPYGICSNKISDEANHHWGLTDVTFENFIVEHDGTKVLIDAGN